MLAFNVYAQTEYLVGHHPLNDDSKDESGNDAHGEVVNGVVLVEDKFRITYSTCYE